jgi:hypothetical protein
MAWEGARKRGAAPTAGRAGKSGGPAGQAGQGVHARRWADCRAGIGRLHAPVHQAPWPSWAVRAGQVELPRPQKLRAYAGTPPVANEPPCPCRLG